MFIPSYCKDLLHLFSQHYNVFGAKKINELSSYNKQQIAIMMLNEVSSPFDPAELLLLPSAKNKDTLITILEAHWCKTIDGEETVRRITEMVIAAKESELNEMFEELIQYEKLEYENNRREDQQYELYCQQRRVL